MRQEDDAIFWERLAEMPFEEHEQECVLRREHVVLQLGVLAEAKSLAEGRGSKAEASAIGRDIFALGAQLTMLNERIKYIRRLMDSLSWRKAVRSVLGEEAYEQCVVWRVMQEARHQPIARS
jgi:hypothetical protein